MLLRLYIIVTMRWLLYKKKKNNLSKSGGVSRHVAKKLSRKFHGKFLTHTNTHIPVLIVFIIFGYKLDTQNYT